MKIKIWGARGSTPSPIRPEIIREKICQAILGSITIDTTDPESVRNYVDRLPPLLSGTAGGNTTCVQIISDKDIIIIDAGSGIRELGLELMRGPCGQGKGVIHLFFTHPHWDHIQGFPFFIPAFVPGNQLFIYSIHDLKSTLTNQQNPVNFPVSLDVMKATKHFTRLAPGKSFSLGKLRINTIANVHPGKSYAYRFEDEHSTFVFASDAEYKQLDSTTLQPYIDFFSKADALIFDAQYTLGEAWEKVDWGHSSAMIGADLARSAGVKKLVLFHHDPTYSDEQLMEIQRSTVEYQAQDTSRPVCDVVVAYEGLTLDLTPVGSVGLQFVENSETAVLTPTSVFDERGAAQLESQFSSLARGEGRYGSIIDLSQVESLTTASLKKLATLGRSRESASIVLAGPSAHVHQVIELAGFLDLFAVYPDVERALAALRAREALNLPGQVIKNRYRIDERLNDGRLGKVLKAKDMERHRVVAIKVLSATFSTKAVERFISQATALTKLRHENIVQVFDYGTQNDLAFIVEEYKAQATLRDLLSQHKPISPRQALDIALQVTSGLEYAHQRGVIHGNLQPRHIVTGDVTQLRSFELGRLQQGNTLLDTPLVLLSPHYLAPEQILGHVLDARTDLYALGVILYQLFTGQLPFTSLQDRHILEAHLYQTPRPLRELNSNISPTLEHLILKLLAKNPNERYANAQQAYRILRGISLDNEPAAGDRSTSTQHKRVLIGRDRELKQLHKAWDETLNGHGRLIFVAGEAGIGKTLLIQMLSTQVQDGMVLIGHCQAWQGAPAYQPFIEILRTYFATVPPEIMQESLLDQHLAEVARIVPKLRELVPNLPVGTPLEPRQEQLRLMTSVTEFVRQATQGRPWLLIIEDLHWADESSLQLLTHLARHAPSMPLLIIGTYRDTDLDMSHTLLDTLRGLSRHPGYQLVALNRLNQAEVSRMLAAQLNQSVPLDLVDKIYECTEGNPVYVEEVLRGLIDSSVIIQTVDGWVFSEMDEFQLPQTVRDAVMHRIASLNQDTQRLLRQAAVMGRTFKLEDLGMMSGLSEWEVLERLDVALERQLLHEGGNTSTLTFNHAEIQQVLYEDMSILRRRMIHLKAGEALEAPLRTNPERIVEQLAYHFSEAKQYEKAIVYSVEAARQAENAYASQVALRWYRTIIGLIGDMGATKAGDYQMFHVLAQEAIAQILTTSGGYDEALHHYTEARRLVLEEHASLEQRRHLADICRKIARIYKKRGNFTHALEWMLNGLGYIDEDEPAIEGARIYLLGAEVYERQGNIDRAIKWCELGLESARRIDARHGKQAVAKGYYLMGNIYRSLGNLPHARQMSEKSLEAYTMLNDVDGVAQAYIGIANIYVDQANWDEATNALQQSLVMKRELGDVYDQARIMYNLADIYLNRGDTAQALDLYQQSINIWKNISSLYFEAKVLSRQAQIYLALQDWAQAEQCLQQSQVLFAEINSSKLLPELHRRWAELYLGQNQIEQALNEIQQSVQLAFEHRELIEQAMSCRVLGEIQIVRQDYDSAEAALIDSLKILTDLASHYEVAKTKLVLAQLLHLREEEGVDTHLIEVIQTFEKLGAKTDLQKARHLRRYLQQKDEPQH